MIFNIEKCPYYEGTEIFSKSKLELAPNSISCFIGCNGSGKTTLISEIKEKLYDLKATEVRADFYYNNMKGLFRDQSDDDKNLIFLDFNKRTTTSFSEMDYYMNAARLGYSSTGEGIMDRFGNHLAVIGTIVRAIKNKTIFIFFDDCDAGTSIDMINDIKSVFELIKEDCEKNNVTYYMILTANSFELCKDLDCISVHDFKHRQFKTYQAYKNFVLKSRKLKDKRNEEK